MATQSDLHVVFGSGPAGLTLAEELHTRGHRVRLVNRKGGIAEPVPEGVELVAGDAANLAAVTALSTGAATIYNCTHVSYEQWPEVLPRLQENFIEGAATSGAKLVVVDTLYLYGPTGGQPMTEETPHLAISRKGRMRAQLAWGYLQAHRTGRARVAIGRAADFFGPRVTNSALGQFAFPAAIKGEPMVAFGNVDLLHSYAFIPDVARGVATLGERDDALGQDWLLPAAPVRTTREIAALMGDAIGHAVDIAALPSMEVVASLGVLDPTFLAEYDELFYQYTEPQIVDSSAIARELGVTATPLPEAIAATVAWYQSVLPHAAQA